MVNTERSDEISSPMGVQHTRTRSPFYGLHTIEEFQQVVAECALCRNLYDVLSNQSGISLEPDLLVRIHNKTLRRYMCHQVLADLSTNPQYCNYYISNDNIDTAHFLQPNLNSVQWRRVWIEAMAENISGHIGHILQHSVLTLEEITSELAAINLAERDREVLCAIAGYNRIMYLPYYDELLKSIRFYAGSVGVTSSFNLCHSIIEKVGLGALIPDKTTSTGPTSN
jgi:hypothetical protein